MCLDCDATSRFRHVCYHGGAIQTTGAGPQHDIIVCCKIIEQFKTVALYGSKQLCLLCVACCSCPGAQHPRRAVAPGRFAAYSASEAHAPKLWDPG